MKITVITSPFGCLPPNGYGAVERIWFDIANEIRQKGHNVTLISKQDPQMIMANSDEFKYIRGYGRTKSIFFDLFFDFLYSFRALQELDRSDILVLNTFWSPILIRFFTKKARKVVYNVQRIPKGQFALYSNVDRFYCVSNSVIKSLLNERPKLMDKITLIGNPVNTRCFYFHEQAKNASSIKILYYGRIHPEKGLEILVKSIDNLISRGYNVGLKLIGPYKIAQGGGGEEFVKFLNDSAKNFQIDWHPPISDIKLLRERLIDCDIFCYPSIAEKGETFGVAPLEAMATGRATIVSALDCFKDFVNHGKNGLIFNHKMVKPEEDLSKQFEVLFNDRDLRNRIAKEASYTALEFSNSNIANAYLTDFKDVLGSIN